MLKKTITYNDYNGVERTETYYFNLSKAEIAEMELSHDGGITELLKKIVEEKNGSQMIAFWKDFILRSYGEKSLDGKRFMKNQEIRDSFVSTEAYSELFMELATNTEAAINFVNGVLPTNAAQNTQQQKQELQTRHNQIQQKLKEQ